MKRKRKPAKKGAAEVAAAAAAAEASAPTASASKQRRAARRAAERAAAEAGEDPEAAGAAAVAAVRAKAEGPQATGKKGKVLRKRRRVPEEEPESDEDSDDSDDDDEDDDEGGESEPGEDIDVDFEFYDPNEDDYHSVADLVKNGTWEFVELNFSEMVDSICEQGNIGSLVKSGMDDPSPDREVAVCGLLTTLNMRQFAHQSWPKVIQSALLKKAKGNATPEAQAKLEGVLAEKRKEGQEVGLLFSERFINLPPQLIPPLHRALLEDIEWSCNTPECPPEEKPFYGFTHFVGVTKCFEAPPKDEVEKAPPGKTKKKPRKGASSDAAPAKSSGPWFPRLEDRAYWSKATASFTFPLAANTDKPSKEGSGDKGKGKELRAVFMLTKKAMEAAVAEIEKLYKEEAEKES